MRIYIAGSFLTFLAAAFILQQGSAQTVADFEDFNLSPGQHLNDASPATAFQSGSIELPNAYDPEFNFWSGWSISADTNRTTPGFSNQFSAIPGKGALNSTTYGVGYIFDPIVIRLQPNAIGKPMIGLFITNSTYSYLSMRDGDPFAKKFGGETGDDPDFLMVTFKKYAEGLLSTDSVNVYLADYRFVDANMDYILSNWTYVDLTALGQMDSLSMQMRSSDNGVFGMNTPAYVCVDQVTTDDLQFAEIQKKSISNLQLKPNPVSDRLFFEVDKDGPLVITNIEGLVIWSQYLAAGSHDVSVAGWPQGAYVIKQKGSSGVKFFVQ
jgi:hypothetical protein